MNIPVKNIYYMLSYAFNVLNEDIYRNAATEEFDNTANLFSEILILGLNKQIKQGLLRDYIEIDENLSTIRGKIDITESIKTQSFLKNKLNCNFDEFSLNFKLNQIIKTTIFLLLKSNSVDDERKIKLKRIMLYFYDVDLIENVHSINWNIRYHRNNQNYRMLIYFCELIINGLLITEEDGEVKIRDFLDDQRFHMLYEKFVLNFYKKEFPSLQVYSPIIPWKIDDENYNMLPRMETDIVLEYTDKKILIIDTKAYQRITRGRGNAKINSNHLYQIFSYVKNKEEALSGETHEVAGMLLYAKTYDGVYPDEEYQMSGNLISVKTLDLNQEFDEISEQLKNIAVNFFGDEIL